jgi:hypothetical protein
MKLNLGCGHRKQAGYVNVDLSPECHPDEVWNLEELPWPWATSSADEVLFIHSLEHLGQSTASFLGIMKELYRICRDGAVVRVHVPHPRHDFYLGDPTHVRPITPETLALFDKARNDEWARTGSSAGTPLAHYLGVDFTIVQAITMLDEPYSSQYTRKEISDADLNRLLRERNNIAYEFQIELQVRKPA